MLDWLLEQLTTDEIEEVPESFLETGTFFQVTDEMLDALVEKNDRVLAVFCKISDLSSSSSSLHLWPCSVRSPISPLHLLLSAIRISVSPPYPLPCIIPLLCFCFPPIASPVFLLCVTQNPVFITAIPLSQMMQRIRPRKIASLRSSPLMTISTKRTSSPSKWQTPWRREIMG